MVNSHWDEPEPVFVRKLQKIIIFGGTFGIVLESLTTPSPSASGSALSHREYWHLPFFQGAASSSSKSPSNPPTSLSNVEGTAGSGCIQFSQSSLRLAPSSLSHSELSLFIEHPLAPKVSSLFKKGCKRSSSSSFSPGCEGMRAHCCHSRTRTPCTIL